MIASTVAAIAISATMTITKISETVSGRPGAGPAREIPGAEADAIKRRRTAPKAAKEAAMRTADKYIPRRKT